MHLCIMTRKYQFHNFHAFHLFLSKNNRTPHCVDQIHRCVFSLRIVCKISLCSRDLECTLHMACHRFETHVNSSSLSFMTTSFLLKCSWYTSMQTLLYLLFVTSEPLVLFWFIKNDTLYCVQNILQVIKLTPE